jgi:hypothetical protein
MSQETRSEQWVRVDAARFPNESDAHRRARNELLAAEIAKLRAWARLVEPAAAVEP